MVELIRVCPGCEAGDHTKHTETYKYLWDKNDRYCTCDGDCAEKYQAKIAAETKRGYAAEASSVRDAHNLLNSKGFRMEFPPDTQHCRCEDGHGRLWPIGADIVACPVCGNFIKLR